MLSSIHAVISTASLFHRLNAVLPSRCFKYASVCFRSSQAFKNLFSLVANQKKKASLSSGGMSTDFSAGLSATAWSGCTRT